MSSKQEFTCAAGHGMLAPRNTARCLAFVHGVPCTSPIKAHGPGSLEVNKRLRKRTNNK